MARPTVGLAMLVRDEAATIERALTQTLEIVDHVTLLDTGSIDDTIDIAHAALDGFPHVVASGGWTGFGPARTKLLNHARRFADYTLMLDADHQIHVTGDPPDFDADSYTIKILGRDEWRLPLLTRSQHPFEYRGVAHAYLASDVPPVEKQTDWIAIDGGPGASRQKLERDRLLLEQAYLAEPHDARTVFYLAQTYRDLDEHDLAIRFYRMRAEMGGFAEEAYWARYQAGVILGERVSFSAGADELLAAWRYRPTRVEALRALANLANSVADKAPKPDDVLFVQPSAYLTETTK